MGKGSITKVVVMVQRVSGQMRWKANAACGIMFAPAGLTVDLTVAAGTFRFQERVE